MGFSTPTLLATASVLALAGYAVLSLSAGGEGLSSPPGAAIQTSDREPVLADTRWGRPAQGKVPLDIPLPKPQFTGTPPELEHNEHIEPPSDRPRPAFLAPPGVQNGEEGLFGEGVRGEFAHGTLEADGVGDVHVAPITIWIAFKT